MGFAAITALLLQLPAVSAEDLESRHPGATAFVEQIAADTPYSHQEVAALLSDAQRQQSIIDAMTRPAEAMPWHRYRKIFMTDKRLQAGIDFYQSHKDTVHTMAEEYQVAPEIILAIIGVETHFGKITGSYRVLDALVTLGFHYPPRAEFFRKELAHFLSLSAEEDLPPDAVLGSYAGAMGLGQFIPSSYRAYARDGDGDGSRDLWRSVPDAVASVANYFREHRWQPGAPVAIRVQRQDGARDLDLKVKPQYPLKQIQEWGYQPAANHDIPDSTLASLVALEQEDGLEYWAVFDNFYCITRYNRSPLYAMAVLQLSQQFAEKLGW